MSKLKLTGKQIRAIGYEEGPVVSVAMHTMSTHFKHHSEEGALQILKDVLTAPENFLKDEKLKKIAAQLRLNCSLPSGELEGAVSLNEKGVAYNVFGAKHIEEGALLQM